MNNDYSLGETIKNIISLIYTKIFYKKARLIRRPFYLRGKKYLSYGEGLTTGYSCRLEVFNIHSISSPILIIGNNCKLGDYVHIAAGERIEIGDNCLLASKIFISDISHGDYSDSKNASNPNTPPDKRKLTTKQVIIGNNVWIGDNACILPGVKIGNGVIIAANAVVNRNIPDNSIAAGVPAKIVKQFDNKLNVWKKLENLTSI
jgi:acetyltransferase-like isoleucine patch superfamily enzyme